MDFLTYQLAAGIDDEDAQLGVCTEVEIDLAEMAIGRTLLLQDDPGDFRVFIDDQVADDADEARRIVDRKMTLDHRGLRVRAEGHREAAVALAGALHELQFKRLFQHRFGRDFDLETIADEGAVDTADGIVRTTLDEIGGGHAFDEAFAVAADMDAFGRTGDIGLAVQDPHDRGTDGKRLNALGEGGRVGSRNRAQQGAQVAIVPGFDAARRQAFGLQRVEQRVAGRKHRAVARQFAELGGVGIDESRLGCCHRDCRLDVHENLLRQRRR